MPFVCLDSSFDCSSYVFYSFFSFLYCAGLSFILFLLLFAFVVIINRVLPAKLSRVFRVPQASPIVRETPSQKTQEQVVRY